MKLCIALSFLALATVITRISAAFLYAVFINKNNCQERFLSLYRYSFHSSSSLFSLNASLPLGVEGGMQKAEDREGTIIFLQPRDIEERAILFYSVSTFSEGELASEKEWEKTPDKSKEGWWWGLWKYCWPGTRHDRWWTTFSSILSSTFLWDHMGSSSALYWREWMWWTKTYSSLSESVIPGGSIDIPDEEVLKSSYFLRSAFLSVDERWYIRSQLPWWCSKALLPSWWSSSAISELDRDEWIVPATTTTTPASVANRYARPFFFWWWWTKELFWLIGTTLSPSTVVLCGIDGLTAIFAGFLILFPRWTSTISKNSDHDNSEKVVKSMSPSSLFSLSLFFSPSPFCCWCMLLFGFAWNPALVLLPLEESLLCVESFAIFGSLCCSWLWLRLLFSPVSYTVDHSCFFVVKKLIIISFCIFLSFFLSSLLGVSYLALPSLLLFMLGTKLALWVVKFIFCRRFCFSPFFSTFFCAILRNVIIFASAAAVFIGSTLSLWIYINEGSHLFVFSSPMNFFFVLSLFWSYFSLGVTPALGGYTGSEGNLDHFPPSLSPYWYVRAQIPFAEYQKALDFLLLVMPVWIALSGSLLCFLFLYDVEDSRKDVHKNTRAAKEQKVVQNDKLISPKCFSEECDPQRTALKDASGTAVHCAQNSVSSTQRSEMNESSAVEQPSRYELYLNTDELTNCSKRISFRNLLCANAIELFPQLALLLSLCFKSTFLFPHFVWTMLLLQCHSPPFSFFPFHPLLSTANQRTLDSNERVLTDEEVDRATRTPSRVGRCSSNESQSRKTESTAASSSSYKKETKDAEKRTRKEGIKMKKHVTMLFTTSASQDRRNPTTTTTNIAFAASPSTSAIFTVCVLSTMVVAFAAVLGVGHSWLIQEYYLSALFFVHELILTFLLFVLLCLWLWERLSC